MLSTNFWTSIKLDSNEELKFQELDKLFEQFNPRNERETLVEEILLAPENSFDLKRKAVKRTFMLPVSRAWGLQNFSGADLHGFIEIVFTLHFHDLIAENLATLAANPAFIGSRGEVYDSIHLIFESLPVAATGGMALRENIILYLISEETMDLATAMLVVSKNRKENSMGDIFPLTMDEKPVIEWTRKAYNLGDVPDSWIVKFLGGE